MVHELIDLLRGKKITPCSLVADLAATLPAALRLSRLGRSSWRVGGRRPVGVLGVLPEQPFQLRHTTFHLGDTPKRLPPEGLEIRAIRARRVGFCPSLPVFHENVIGQKRRGTLKELSRTGGGLGRSTFQTATLGRAVR